MRVYFNKSVRKKKGMPYKEFFSYGLIGKTREKLELFNQL